MARDLVRATAAVLRGAAEARASWAEEPGEYRWILSREGDRLRLRLLGFAGLWNSDPDERGDVRLDAYCDPYPFGAAIAEGSRRVLDEWGEDGYRARWVEHDFPTAKLQELEKLVDCSRRPKSSPSDP